MKRIVITGLVFLFASLVAASAWAQKKPVTFGVVFDGKSERWEEYGQIFQREITTLLSTEFEPKFPDAKKIRADWTKAGVNKALDQLLADPEVDVLLALGVVASNEIVRRKELPKPSVAPIVLDRRAQGLWTKEGKLIRKNLSYIEWTASFKRSFEIFREFGDFKKMAMLTNATRMAAMPELGAALNRDAKAVGIEIVIVPVENDVAKALAAIPPDADSVYFTPNSQLSMAQVKQLAEGLIKEGLPSYSYFGRLEVEQGLLVGVGSPEDLDRLARRVALNVQAILLGDPPERLVTAYKMSEKLVINMETARRIGLWPDWSLMTEAVLLNRRREQVKRKLTLSGAVKEALKANLDLAANTKFVAAGERDISSARSGLFPQLSVSLDGAWIDDDRGSPLGQAERTLSWSSRLEQSIYNESTYGNLAVQKHLQRGRLHERRRLELDVARDAAVAYLTLLKAQTFERLRGQDLSLTRENLALARVRSAAGTASPAEVFRWEAQIADRRRDLIDSISLRNQAEIEVNRILNRPLEEPFMTKETTLDDPTIISSEKGFRQFLSNSSRFRTLRAFMVQEALENSPELRELGSAMAATRRATASNRRSIFIPQVGVQAGTTHRFLEGGAGSETTPPPGSGTTFPNNFDWQVGVSMRLPLFEGGVTKAAIDRGELEYQNLSLQKKALEQRIATRVRTTLHRTGSAYASIRLAEDAVKASRSNLELVTDSYGQGTANIIALLDAQNQALAAELGAATAVYDFLIQLMQVERAIGRREFFRTDGETKALFNRLDAFSRSQAGQATAAGR